MRSREEEGQGGGLRGVGRSEEEGGVRSEEESGVRRSEEGGGRRKEGE